MAQPKNHDSPEWREWYFKKNFGRLRNLLAKALTEKNMNIKDLMLYIADLHSKRLHEKTLDEKT